MLRILGSPWFLGSTALCCAIGVGFTSWIADDSSAGVRAVATLIGLGAALGVMALVAWVLESDTELEPARAAPVEEVEWPMSDAAPTAVIPRDALTLELDEGRALKAAIEPGASDARVGVWIARVRARLEDERPGVLGYYDALGNRAFADDRDRLEAHLDRLATIIGDFL